MIQLPALSIENVTSPVSKKKQLSPHVRYKPTVNQDIENAVHDGKPSVIEMAVGTNKRASDIQPFRVGQQVIITKGDHSGSVATVLKVMKEYMSVDVGGVKSRKKKTSCVLSSDQATAVENEASANAGGPPTSPVTIVAAKTKNDSHVRTTSNSQSTNASDALQVGMRVQYRTRKKIQTGTVQRLTKKQVEIVIDGVGPKRVSQKSCQPLVGELENNAGATARPRSTNTLLKIVRPQKKKNEHHKASMIESGGSEWRVTDSKNGGTRVGTRRFQKIRLESNPVDDSLLTHSFQARLRIIDILLNKEESEVPFETTFEENESRYELVSSKIVKGPGIETISLRDYLMSIGDFSKLKPRKVMARLELFQSPACKVPGRATKASLSKNEKFAKFGLKSASFGVMPPNGNDGCGVICEDLLVELLGGNEEARRAFAIQIRAFIPSLGIFKGMLCRKRITSGPPIQLDPTMLKVEPCCTSIVDDRAFLVIRKTMPSQNSWYTGRQLDPQHKKGPPPKSFKIKKTEKSDMLPCLIKGLGVPEETCNDYFERCVKPKHLNHAWVVGLADPTGCIPPNHIYVTGMRGSVATQDRLFVTRSPCTKPEDGRIVPNLISKPSAMSDEDWDSLQQLEFGAIIFGAPKKGMCPLPELIAKGDLDGDLYLVCWNQEILDSIQTIPIEDVPIKEEEASSSNGVESCDDWLEQAQSLMIDAASANALGHLTGKLYKLMGECSEESDLGIADPDAIAFADAFNQSLEFGKHGNQIHVPLHLHQKIPEPLRKLLLANK